MKFRADRVQDLADISRMIARADRQTVAKSGKVLMEYLPDSLDDFKSLLSLGKLELGHKERNNDKPK